MEIIVDCTTRNIEKVSNHLLILNQRQLFNLNLSNKTIMDFYSNYRSISAQNNSLPRFYFLDIGSETDEIFDLDTDGSIQLVRLSPLFKTVMPTFFYYLEMAIGAQIIN